MKAGTMNNIKDYLC